MDEQESIAVGGCSNSRMVKLEEKVGELIRNQESLERLVVSQSQLQSRLLGDGSSGERACAKLINVLRQKTALLLQRGIPSVRQRKDAEDVDNFFEDCCSGVLRTDVDCCLRDFDVLARVVRSRSKNAHFRPRFLDTQCSSESVNEAEICFESLLSLCEVIGIRSLTDLHYISKRLKGSHQEKDKHTTETAVRLLGTYLFDPDDRMSATVFLLCQGMDEARLNGALHAVTRPTREFKFASMAYRHRLVSERETGSVFIKKVFESQLTGLSSEDKDRAIGEIVKGVQYFKLRWRPLPAPYSRVWTRYQRNQPSKSKGSRQFWLRNHPGPFER